MAGHVEFRHHADAAVGRVGHDVADLVLRIEQRIAAELLQPRIDAAFHAEALVVRQMPVEHVELDHRHAIERALDDVHRLEVAGDVEQQAAPAEARRVPDLGSLDVPAASVAGLQLQECLQPANRPDHGRCGQHRLAG